MVAAGTGEVVRPLLLPEVLPTNQQTRLQLLTLIDSDVSYSMGWALGGREKSSYARIAQTTINLTRSSGSGCSCTATTRRDMRYNVLIIIWTMHLPPNGCSRMPALSDLGNRP